MRAFLLCLLLLPSLGACTPEQSQSIGNAPKKTIDRVTVDVNKAMQQGQGAERLKENESQ